MSGYDYKKQRGELFTEEGQVRFLRVYKWAMAALERTGAFTMSQAMRAAGSGGTSWDGMACVDRMVELGEIREVKPRKELMSQYRVFCAVLQG